MTNIVLTGFMGTGKSAAGRRLAARLGLEFLDMDELIASEAGMPVKEIFKNHGEEHFRKLERDVVKRLVSGGYGEGLVVSTGGGAVVDAGSRAALKGWALVVCLTASVEKILARVGNSEERPLLARPDREEAVRRLLCEREAAYRDSGVMIDTTHLNLDGVVEAISRLLKDRS